MNNLNILNNIKIILCNTTHNGNLGAAARAMKTMNITNLVLVDPVAKIDDHAYALSSNARDILENAHIFNTLQEALEDTTLAYALTARNREFNYHLKTPKESIPEILSVISSEQKIALVFGAERTGLTIEQLELCNRLITIPGNKDYFSLNLAQAVQIMVYEIFSTFNNVNQFEIKHENLASFNDNQGILNHLDQILTEINYYKSEKLQQQTIRNLQNIINKASLVREEVDLIRGILRKIDSNL